MKRSEINSSIKWAEELCKKHHITLPPFASLPAQKELFNIQKRETIVKAMLGWDVSDFGSGDFTHCGAVLFTVRNGVWGTDIGTPYAEKYIFMKDGCEQEIPLHYHVSKTEDIINRAGGILCVQLFAAGNDGRPDQNAKVTVFCDGEKLELDGGTTLDIPVGASITLTPYLYHRFYAKTGAGDLLVGEVSKVNDDKTDNYFANPSERFCEIEEDEPKYRLLVNEY